MSSNRILADWIPDGTPTADQHIIIDDPVAQTTEWGSSGTPPATAQGQVLISGIGPNFAWAAHNSIDNGRY